MRVDLWEISLEGRGILRALKGLQKTRLVLSRHGFVRASRVARVRSNPSLCGYDLKNPDSDFDRA